MNINDYIKWRGDLSFKVDPFNEVDNLILSEIIYSPIEKYFKSEKDEYTIEELNDLFFKDNSEKDLRESKSLVALTPLLFKEMALSKRFKDLKVHHCISKFDREHIYQFCAAQIDIDSKTTYVAFRGTDDTLTGWKEDFEIAYRITDGQMIASDYCKQYLSFRKKYIFGGHSKGGNLAFAAAISAPKIIKKNIIKIYSNDGPGLNRDFYPLESMNEFKDRFIKIVPSYDVFGTIFDEGKDFEHISIKSDAFTVMQHDGLKWQVEGNKFVREKLKNESKTLIKAFDKFMKNVPTTQRENFVKELFEVIDELGVDNISKLSETSALDKLKVIKRLSELDSESKEAVIELTKIIESLIKQRLEDITSGIMSSVKEKK